jgi:hypothetical protein
MIPGVCLITDNGLKVFGALVRESREANGWSIRALKRKFEETIEYSFSLTTYTRIEEGGARLADDTKIILWNFAVEGFRLHQEGKEEGFLFLINPKTGKPFSVEDYRLIMTEELDPLTGEIREGCCDGK